MNKQEKEQMQGLLDCIETIVREPFSKKLVFSFYILFLPYTYLKRFKKDYYKYLKEQ